MYRFLYDAADASMIDGLGLQPDPELAARNLDKARKAIASLGPKWVLFNDRAAQNQDDERGAQSHTER